MGDQQERTVAPTSHGNVTIADVVELLAHDPDVYSNPTEKAPTEGRVVKDATDGTRYLGTGDSWLNVDEDGGLQAFEIDIEEIWRNDIMASFPAEVVQIDHGEIAGGGTYDTITYEFSYDFDEPPNCQYSLGSTEAFNRTANTIHGTRSLTADSVDVWVRNGSADPDTFDHCTLVVYPPGA